MVTVTVMDGHGHVDGRLKRSGTIWNEVKRNERVDHGHGTFPAKNERFTVRCLMLLVENGITPLHMVYYLKKKK